MTVPSAVRLYKIWQGSNRFFCGGRLIFGPDVASLLLTSVLIGGPAIAFCITEISKIKANAAILGYPVLIVAAFITISDLTFLMLTSARDPGIVPRNTHPPESDEMFDSTTPSMEWIHGRTPHLRLPRTKDVLVNGIIVKVKFCDTCLLYRPPRSSHCSICNNCVQKFDHHCPWVGQCIGLRNYRFFFLFISSSTFLCIYVFTFSWLNVLHQKRNGSLWSAMSRDVVSVVLIVYCFIAVWFVGGLTVFHLYLIGTNQTTYENFRYRYDKKENPYNRGFLRNFAETFFSRIPPSLNDFRSWVFEDPIDNMMATQMARMDTCSSMDKMDIEMGNKFGVSGSMQVPNILQNLDYSGIDDDLKRKDGQDDNEFDDFFFPIVQETGNGNQNYLALDLDATENKDCRDDVGGEECGFAEGTIPLDNDLQSHNQQEVLQMISQPSVEDIETKSSVEDIESKSSVEDIESKPSE
ncbi:hypothetical protein H6P81_007850 [Aristolochia fimbriata]|uniref:S-acyltransferase n=1 Tax=Aristolochia fimbriata TaxID=158543 RepID=A0AAV7F484_ARIFI|nr:hypothetical protein H6P81_007850 [Aristolochia fimbriata]